MNAIAKKTATVLSAIFVMLWFCAPLAQADPVDCSITSFSLLFGNQTKYAHIDHENNTILIDAPYGTNLFNELFTPVIKVPAGVSVSPAAGVPQYFIGDMVYTLTLLEGKSLITKEYIVRVSVDGPPAIRPITVFKLNGVSGVINEFNKTISVTLPEDADIRSLTPEIIYTGAGISPAIDQPMDFSAPVAYRIIKQDGQEITYSVIVKAQ